MGTLRSGGLASLANPAAAARYQKLIGEIHSSTLPVDAWIDSSNRVNQIRIQIPVPAGTGASANGGTEIVTVQFFDFGVPVTVTAPLPIRSGR